MSEESPRCSPHKTHVKGALFSHFIFNAEKQKKNHYYYYLAIMLRKYNITLNANDEPPLAN